MQLLSLPHDRALVKHILYKPVTINQQAIADCKVLPAIAWSNARKCEGNNNDGRGGMQTFVCPLSADLRGSDQAKVKKLKRDFMISCEMPCRSY